MRSLCLIRSVCKQWDRLTGHPWLHSMRLARGCTIEHGALILISRSDMNNEATCLELMTERCTRPKPLESFPGWCHVKQSCEGLFCIVKRKGIMPQVFVSNPLRGEHITLPPFTANSCSPAVSIFGFGFDSSVEKYKMVCVFYRDIDFPNKRCSLGAQVCIIGPASSCSWRDIMSRPTVPIMECKNSVYAGGARHWLVDYKLSSNDSETMVICFDFVKEEFKTLPRQDFFLVSRSDQFDLVDLRGNLGMVHPLAGVGIEIWKLKDYERNEWVREYRIGMLRPSSIEVLGLMGEAELLLSQYCKVDVENVALLAYNLRTATLRNIYTVTDGGPRKVFLHTANLVSPSS